MYVKLAQETSDKEKQALARLFKAAKANSGGMSTFLQIQT